MKHRLTVYEGVNQTVLSLVPRSANCILDVGCGTGALGGCLRHERHRTIVGITYSPQEAEQAARRLSRVICADLNTFDFRSLGKFDCVILSHILEHLYAPEDLLHRIRPLLSAGSVLLIALPNVLWWRQRLEFLLGRWRYQDWGILDRTHFRFFDQQSSRHLIEDAGYEIVRALPDGPFPLTSRFRKQLGPVHVVLDRIGCLIAPGLFAQQFLYLAQLTKAPGA